MTTFSGKVVCVTGAAGGIASAIIGMLAREGAHLALIDRDEARLAQLAEHLRGTYDVPLSCAISDLATEQGVQSGMAQALAPFDGHVDMLVATVGALMWERFEALSSQQWQQAFAINFFSHVWAVQTVLPVMQRQSHGRILFIGSDQASQPDEGLAAYAAAKAGIHNLTKTLAREFAPKILVNCVAPGMTRTRLVEGLMNYYAHTYETSVAEAERLEVVENRKIPLGRLGEPHEVADAARLMLTNDFTTGTILDCSGGNVRGI